MTPPVFFPWQMSFFQETQSILPDDSQRTDIADDRCEEEMPLKTGTNRNSTESLNSADNGDSRQKVSHDLPAQRRQFPSLCRLRSFLPTGTKLFPTTHPFPPVSRLTSQTGYGYLHGQQQCVGSEKNIAKTANTTTQ